MSEQHSFTHSPMKHIHMCFIIPEAHTCALFAKNIRPRVQHFKYASSGYIMPAEV